MADHSHFPPALSDPNPNGRAQRNDHARDSKGVDATATSDEEEPACSGFTPATTTTTTTKDEPLKQDSNSSSDSDSISIASSRREQELHIKKQDLTVDFTVTTTEKSHTADTFSSASSTSSKDDADQDISPVDEKSAAAAAIVPTVTVSDHVRGKGKGADVPAAMATGAGPFDLLQPHTLTTQQVITYLSSSQLDHQAAASSSTAGAGGKSKKKSATGKKAHKAALAALNAPVVPTPVDLSRFALDPEQDAAGFTKRGLSQNVATARLESVGPNQVSQAPVVSAWTILLRQVANALTLVLVAAMALSFGVRDWVEGAVVTIVILINVALGFVQEYKAERTMANLRQLSSPTALVLRDNGEERSVPSDELVPGDVVLFKMGDVLPADVRLLSVSNLEVDEAALTGESMPVIKHVDAIPDPSATLGPGDQLNMAFASTTVTKGRGRGIVVATGMRTQLGKIAAAMQERRDAAKHSHLDADGRKLSVARRAINKLKDAWEACARFLGLREGTPLQIRLNKFAYILFALALLCAIIVFGVAEFDITNEVILYAIALGIGESRQQSRACVLAAC